MRRKNGEAKEYIYSCNYLSGDIYFIENQSFEIRDIKGLPIAEALEVTPLNKFECL